MKPVIVLAHFFPFPPQVGAEIRTNFIVKTLAGMTEVILIAPEKLGADIEEAKKYCREVYQVKNLSDKKSVKILRRAKELFSFFPASGRHINIKGFKEILNSISEKYSEALIWLEAIWLMEVLKKDEERDIILNQHNIDSLVTERRYKNAKLPLKILFFNDFMKQRRYERKNIRRVVKIFAVSEEEKKKHKEIFGDLNIDVLPNAIEIERYPLLLPNSEEATITMTGDFGYSPNVEGFSYFMSRIFGKIKEKIDNLKVMVAGRKSKNIRVLSGNVVLYGEFDDPSEVYKKTTISVAPILVGGGSRYKIIESLAFGIPVVSTREGAEGLELSQDEGLYVGKDEEDFAEKVVRLLKNYELAKESGKKGRKSIEDKYSYKTLTESFEKSLKEILQ